MTKASAIKLLRQYAINFDTAHCVLAILEQANAIDFDGERVDLTKGKMQVMRVDSKRWKVTDYHFKDLLGDPAVDLKEVYRRRNEFTTQFENNPKYTSFQWLLGDNEQECRLQVVEMV